MKNPLFKSIILYADYNKQDVLLRFKLNIKEFNNKYYFSRFYRFNFKYNYVWKITNNSIEFQKLVNYKFASSPMIYCKIEEDIFDNSTTKVIENMRPKYFEILLFSIWLIPWIFIGVLFVIDLFIDVKLNNELSFFINFSNPVAKKPN